MARDPQESIAEVGDVLNTQKPAGPLDSWDKKRGHTETQQLEGAAERSQIAECSGTAAAECSLQYLAAIGAGRVGLRPRLGHMLATRFTSLKLIFSVCAFPGGMSARACLEHSAGHTGGPPLVRLPSLSTSLPGLPPEMASVRDKARPRSRYPSRLWEAARERCLAAPGQLPVFRGS